MLMELTMFPTDKGESVSEFVAPIIKTIKTSGISYQLTPMGTILEGEYDELFALVKKCFDQMSHNANRININIKGDWRRGATDQMKAKIKSIESKI